MEEPTFQFMQTDHEWGTSQKLGVGGEFERQDGRGAERWRKVSAVKLLCFGNATVVMPTIIRAKIGENV